MKGITIRQQEKRSSGLIEVKEREHKKRAFSLTGSEKYQAFQ